MKTHISVAVRGSLAAAIAMLAQFAAPTVGHALPTIASLSVAPGHGQVRSSFALTYQQTPCVLSQLPSGTEIRFSWNGAPPAGQLLGSALTDNTCKATLVTAAPANAGVGSHEVDGFVPVPQDGSPVTGTLATASYSVDVAPTAKASPTATAKATATPGASGTPAPTQSANPSAGATPAPSASAGTGSGSGSGTRGSGNGSGSANGSGSSGNQSSGFGPPPYLGTPVGLLSVPLTFGFILLLLLLVIALLLWAMAQRRRTDTVKGAGAGSTKQAA